MLAIWIGPLRDSWYSLWCCHCPRRWTIGTNTRWRWEGKRTKLNYNSTSLLFRLSSPDRICLADHRQCGQCDAHKSHCVDEEEIQNGPLISKISVSDERSYDRTKLAEEVEHVERYRRLIPRKIQRVMEVQCKNTPNSISGKGLEEFRCQYKMNTQRIL